MLTVTTPAADLALASIEELRAAAGVADTSMDAELEPLGLRIAAEITEACNIAVGKNAEPTLRKERLTETFDACNADELILSRRHNVEIISITQDGKTITLDERSLSAEAGLLERWIDGSRSPWRARTVVVVYDAGFEDVPASLVGIVSDLVRIRLSEATADPLEKSRTIEITDVETIRSERWVGTVPGTGSNGLPQAITDRLRRFTNVSFA